LKITPIGIHSLSQFEVEKSVGAQLKVACKQPNGKMLKFKPTVLNFDRNKEFRWKGKFGIKGIFDGQHYFKLEKLSKNQTKFIHREFSIQESN